MDLNVVEQRRAALEHRYGRWVAGSLAERFDLVAAAHPDRPFVITAVKTLTYAALRARVS